MDTHTERTGGSPTCPDWCCSDHAPTLHFEDRHHHSPARRVVITAGTPTLRPDDDAVATAVLVRLVRRVGSELTWLEIAAEEGREIRLAVTLESARRLVSVLQGLLLDTQDS